METIKHKEWAITIDEIKYKALGGLNVGRRPLVGALARLEGDNSTF